MSGSEKELEARLGHRFVRSELLTLALTHASYGQTDPSAGSNQRLEFLGDAVLDLVLAERMYVAHPEWGEGQLTLARKNMVNSGALAGQARALDLGRHARLGGSEISGGGAEKDSILANLFEAVIGALYLDAGLAPVEALVDARFAEGLAPEAGSLARDPKTRLQEWAHAERRGTPRYAALGDSGVEADPERFSVEVRLEDAALASGRGRTKRAAERAAAAAALAKVEIADG